MNNFKIETVKEIVDKIDTNPECLEYYSNGQAFIDKRKTELWVKEWILNSIVESWKKVLEAYNITSFDKSEETESGVFGVHIVFERKQEV